MIRKLLAFLVFVSAAHAGDNKDLKIVVEPDQTDIFAIPLDEDADEQMMELESFEHYHGK